MVGEFRDVGDMFEVCDWNLSCFLFLFLFGCSCLGDWDSMSVARWRRALVVHRQDLTFPMSNSWQFW